MRFDELVHKSPKLYRKKIDYLIKLKHFIYKFLDIHGNLEEIIDEYNKKRENIYQQFFKNKNVLDIGCGRGEFMDTLMEKYDCKCIGLDASRNMIDSAKQINSFHDYIVGNAGSLPFVGDSIDVINFTHVFHHLPPDVQKKVLYESKKVAMDVIVINDSVNWECRFKHFFANIFWKMTDGGYTYRTELEWRKFLEDETIIDCNIGQYLMRQCLFVIKANGEKTKLF